MPSKVFLFDEGGWLYCTDVTLEDGTYHGWVENGAWHLMYDTKLEGWFACETRSHANSLVAVTKGKAKLCWACDPASVSGNRWDRYNEVIEDARFRYASGEPADFTIKPDPIDEEYELYLKLKAKYDDDDIPY